MKLLKTTQKWGRAAACLGAISTSMYKDFSVVLAHVPAPLKGWVGAKRIEEETGDYELQWWGGPWKQPQAAAAGPAGWQNSWSLCISLLFVRCFSLWIQLCKMLNISTILYQALPIKRHFQGGGWGKWEQYLTEKQFKLFSQFAMHQAEMVLWLPAKLHLPPQK